MDKDWIKIYFPGKYYISCVQEKFEQHLQFILSPKTNLTLCANANSHLPPQIWTQEKKKHNVLVGFSSSSPMKILKSHDLPLDDKFCLETQYFCISTVRHCSAAAKASIQNRKCDWVSEFGLFGFLWGLFVFAKTAPQHRLLGCFRHLSDKSENFLF